MKALLLTSLLVIGFSTAQAQNPPDGRATVRSSTGTGSAENSNNRPEELKNRPVGKKGTEKTAGEHSPSHQGHDAATVDASKGQRTAPQKSSKSQAGDAMGTMHR